MSDPDRSARRYRTGLIRPRALDLYEAIPAQQALQSSHKCGWLSPRPQSTAMLAFHRPSVNFCPQSAHTGG